MTSGWAAQMASEMAKTQARFMRENGDADRAFRIRQGGRADHDETNASAGDDDGGEQGDGPATNANVYIFAAGGTATDRGVRSGSRRFA